MWGMGGCESRVEGIVQGTKRYCTISRKKNVGGEGEGQYLNQKHSLCIQKRKKSKKKTEDQWSCKCSPDILAY